jgi:hypothetical protein
MDQEKNISRSTKPYGFENFSKLYNLYKDHIWLENSQEGFYDLWESADEEQKLLLEKLVDNFTYIDSRKISEICQKIVNQIINKWQISSDNTLVVATCDGDEADGSQALLQRIKNKFPEANRWKENQFINNISVIEKYLSSDLTIVLLDDFIGTGNTISKRIDFIKEKIIFKEVVNVKIYLVAAAAMGFSKTKLDKLEIESYYYEMELRRGITESFIDEEKDIAIKSMEKFESKLSNHWDKLKLPKFGYERSESLFAIEDYNIPNNVFPIFWWPYCILGKSRKTIFARVSQRR